MAGAFYTDDMLSPQRIAADLFKWVSKEGRWFISARRLA
jgi:hypothetical protein